MAFDTLSLLILVLVVPLSFVLSSAAGLGGSLILVPALIMALGVKQGVALAALLLAVNNLAKLGTYRRTLPVREALLIAVAVMLGAAVGASLMLQAPESWVKWGVIAAFAATLLLDNLPTGATRRAWSALLALGSGATSGFSGMSGPLKGVAIRSLGLKRQYFVGAAAIVSLTGDVTKTIVFANGGLLGSDQLTLALALVPVMIGCTLAGRRINQNVGERGYALLFWTVMTGYTARLVFA